MVRRVGRIVIAAAAIGAALLVANAAVSVYQTAQLRDESAAVLHSNELLLALDNVLSLVKDAEGGQRGYVITGRQEYLAPYRAAGPSIQAQMDALERLTKGDPVQQRLMADVRRRVGAKLGELDLTIGLRDRKGFDLTRDVISLGAGRAEMEALRATAAEMAAHETQQLVAREAAADRTYRAALVGEALSTLAALAALIGFSILLARHLRARDEAQALVSAQGERLRVTLASIGDAVVTTDLDGRIVDLNPVAEALTGWAVGEAQGQSLEAVFCIINESTREPVENPALRALRDGVIVGLANHTLLIAKDGSETPIDDSAAPIRDRQGRVHGCILVFRDISERKAAERELGRAQARLQRVVTDMAIPTMVFAEDGEVVLVNDAWTGITGYSAAELATIPQWTSKAYGARAEAMNAVIASLFELEESVDNGEREITTASGQTRIWHFVTAPIGRDGTGRRMLVTNAVDVTEKKRAVDALEDADRRKDEFLATLAHELRNPLAPLRNSLAILQRSADDPATFAKASGVMERQLGHLVRLIDDLLDVSRIGLDKLTLRLELADLAAVLEHAVEASRPAAERAGHVLEVRLPECPVKLEADRARLSQVFSNLIGNACKFTPDGGRVVVDARVEGERAVVSVRDNGIGIAADRIGGVFEMFSQIDNSLERTHGGLGIGLTLVRRLVEMHGGSVVAKSAGLGEGSEFVVTLPLRQDTDAAIARPAPAAAALPAGRLRMLVVDDNGDSAESLALLLALAGHETHVAHSGPEALVRADALRPDAVLLDLGLPGLNGYEVCRRLRAAAWAREIPIVAITGWGQADDRQRSRDAGFDGHLVKPVAFGELTALLDESLR